MNASATPQPRVRYLDLLEHEDVPEPGRVARWLNKAKQAIQLASLGQETLVAAKELFNAFGLS